MDCLSKLRAIEPALPTGVRAFALHARYWDPKSTACPHDAWVQKVEFLESPNSTDLPPIDRQNRRINISLELPGWNHEDLLVFRYEHVFFYSFVMAELSKSGNRTHGDWLRDLIDLLPDGRVEHRIEFSSGTEWRILCADIQFSKRQIGSA